MIRSHFLVACYAFACCLSTSIAFVPSSPSWPSSASIVGHEAHGDAGACAARRLPSLHVAAKQEITFDALNGKNVLVVSGSGRVGGNVVTQLLKRGSVVTVGGTSIDPFLAAAVTLAHQLPQPVGGRCVIPGSGPRGGAIRRIGAAAGQLRYVSPTAGRFQGKVKTPNGVIAACVSNSVAYIDVCNDYCTESATKAKYNAKAIESNVPCIISTGCWPGVSSLMAKQLVRQVLQQNKNLKPADLNVDFGFFTAGSGGAGATLLVATFLILAEEALTVVKGHRCASL
eukprot:CAMPEP_0198113368 /NCGR_PEP_ID=MMETSP1442-20131203/5051_1 /TAXON_ID= /ORGANISM="Craspedostauros australis, Strain CCMP3328" /LENGTH=284 /DNA_ID=CAMNT_0043770435 /DNA_START=672 /DNA_END=1526 /DNA_ORIENTATION=+